MFNVSRDTNSQKWHGSVLYSRSRTLVHSFIVEHSLFLYTSITLLSLQFSKFQVGRVSRDNTTFIQELYLEVGGAVQAAVPPTE